jgi:hypothetical protein
MGVAFTPEYKKIKLQEEMAAHQVEPKLPSDRFAISLHMLQGYLKSQAEKA